MKGAETVWRHLCHLYESQFLNRAAQPKSDDCRVVEAYSRLSQTLAVNQVREPLRAVEAPLNVLQAESLAEGLLAGLQTRQDKWA